MSYLCRKPVTIWGRKYICGEVIPDGAVLPERARKLESMGYLSAIGQEEIGGEDHGELIKVPYRAVPEAANKVSATRRKPAHSGVRKETKASKKTACK